MGGGGAVRRFRADHEARLPKGTFQSDKGLSRVCIKALKKLCPQVLEPMPNPNPLRCFSARLEFLASRSSRAVPHRLSTFQIIQRHPPPLSPKPTTLSTLKIPQKTEKPIGLWRFVPSNSQGFTGYLLETKNLGASRNLHGSRATSAPDTASLAFRGWEPCITCSIIIIPS